MVTEQGLKLRTKLESAKTLKAATDSTTTHSAGDMIVVGSTIGVAVEDAGVNSEFALVYEAEKIVLPKVTGVSFGAGDAIYFSESDGKVTSVATNNAKCGRALQAAGTADTEVLSDLIVLA